MQSLKKIVTNGLMVLGLSFGLTVSAMAVDFAKYEALAEQGHAGAQYNTGLDYQDGTGVRQNYTKAHEWHQKAANQGHAGAQNMLGSMYDNGHGVRQDYTKARQWYQKAANQGHAGAQYNMGLMYYLGQGVRQNNAQAKEWFGKSCDNGYQTGCDNYRSLNQR